MKLKTKLKFYQNIDNYYEERNYHRQNGTFHFAEPPSDRNVNGVSKIYHEVFLLMKFLQKKPQVKNMKNKYYGLYYAVLKIEVEKRIWKIKKIKI